MRRRGHPPLLGQLRQVAARSARSSRAGFGIGVLSGVTTEADSEAQAAMVFRGALQWVGPDATSIQYRSGPATTPILRRNARN
jgi:hypothetical protein